ncbi:MAG: hypothetical protein LBU14_02015 [Candidatus Peribacteria bacterium]|nr:hypothetical protein [Candidatus Peribacteria bacterium]
MGGIFDSKAKNSLLSLKEKNPFCPNFKSVIIGLLAFLKKRLGDGFYKKPLYPSDISSCKGATNLFAKGKTRVGFVCAFTLVELIIVIFFELSILSLYKTIQKMQEM